MGFYNGQPFEISKTATASSPGFCDPCQKRWLPGEEIAFVRWEPYGNKDYARMHKHCAENHSMNTQHGGSTVDQSWTYGTQREAVEFLKELRHAEMRFDPQAPQTRRYSYRIKE